MDSEQNFFKHVSSLSDNGGDDSLNSTFKSADSGEIEKKPLSFTGRKTQSSPVSVAAPSKSVSEISKVASDAIRAFEKASLPSFADGTKAILSEANGQKFTVAVVGEFSRGKSTFINKLLRKDVLPVANMPTTAMLTRIRHSVNEGITIFDAENNTRTNLALAPTSWEKYVADDNGNDPNGVAFVNINSPLLKSGIEIIDTPGAGDLEEKRARLIGDALKTSDSAIITISATSAMSMSEKLFIEERLISKKTPFLMLIVTKLDQIDVKQRNGIIDYIKQKLDLWKFNGIEVFIPYNMEMPDDKYKSIMGMDKIVNRINSWISSSDRKKLTEQWTALKLKSHFASAINYANEQKCINGESDAEKRNQMLEKKAQMLEKAEAVWEDTKMQMLGRSDECYSMFLNKVDEFKSSLVEKLQYEASHIANPQKWWNEDFPYKLKIEMTNLSNNIEALVSRNYTKDTAWFNAVLEKNFKTSVLISNDEVADKDYYTSFHIDNDVQLKDLSKSRSISRIGLTALSLGVAMGCMAVSIPPMFATMGIGTGGSILSESIFKKKTDAQKQDLKDEIGKRVPGIVDNAASYSQGRIKNMYNNVIREATKQQDAWMESQKSVIASASASGKADIGFDADNFISEMKSLCNIIDRKYAC